MFEGNKFDDDGYPTEEFFEWVEDYDVLTKDVHDLLAEIKDLWAYADSGYWTSTSYRDSFGDRLGTEYRLSTAGWSGNEDIIMALERNTMFWTLYWQSSRRGGHYSFRVPGKNDNKT